VVVHDGAGADIDGEDGGEVVQLVVEPGFTVREVAAGQRIETTEEGAADAAGETVIDTDDSIFDLGASGEGHGSPRFTLSNDGLMD
jgi:hypothetical protein